MDEAYQERDTLRERVGASESKDGTIVVGFGEGEGEQAARAAAAREGEQRKEEVVGAVKEKELVGVGKGAASEVVDDFED